MANIEIKQGIKCKKCGKLDVPPFVSTLCQRCGCQLFESLTPKYRRVGLMGTAVDYEVELTDNATLIPIRIKHGVFKSTLSEVDREV